MHSRYQLKDLLTFRKIGHLKWTNLKMREVIWTIWSRGRTETKKHHWIYTIQSQHLPFPKPLGIQENHILLRPMTIWVKSLYTTRPPLCLYTCSPLGSAIYPQTAWRLNSTWKLSWVGKKWSSNSDEILPSTEKKKHCYMNILATIFHNHSLYLKQTANHEY